MGVSVGRRVGRLRPSFPLDEVGDPALSQGGGLRHVVSDGLRDTCGRERRRGDSSGSICVKPDMPERPLPFKEDLASAASSWMPTLFLESAGDFPDFGIISVSSDFTCDKATSAREFGAKQARRLCYTPATGQHKPPPPKHPSPTSSSPLLDSLSFLPAPSRTRRDGVSGPAAPAPLKAAAWARSFKPPGRLASLR